MKKLFTTLGLLVGGSWLATESQAQIALEYTDTLICPGTQIDMCAAFTGEADALAVDDAYSSQVVNLGFNFNFFGNNYSQCVVSGNGYLSFSTEMAGQWSGYTWGQFTGAGQYVPSIHAAFQDLDLSKGGKLWYQSFGTPGNRRFIVEWCKVPKFGGSCNQYLVTTQIILYEGSNIIEVHTKSLPGTPGCPSTNTTVAAGNAVQGLINPGSGATIYTPGRGPADMWGNTGATEDAVRYTPSATGYTIDTTIAFNDWKIIENANSNNIIWYKEGSNVPIHQGACATVAPTPPTSYYLATYTGTAGCDTAIRTFVDTVHIRYALMYDTLRKEICAGETYNFLGDQVFLTGMYQKTLQNQLGCDSLVTLFLTQNPLPEAEPISAKAADICPGNSYIMKIRPVNGASYQWYKDGAPLQDGTGPNYEAKSPGLYYVVVTSNKGCQNRSETFVITENPVPTVHIVEVSDNNICKLDTISLTAQATGESIEYEWTPGAYFRNTTGAEYSSVKAVVEEPGYINVRVFNIYGCTATDSVYINAEACCDFLLPNAFTPNNDGKNDYFKPRLKTGQAMIKFQIYDRFGKMVYDNRNSKLGWDGTYEDGTPAPTGVYMYVMEYSCTDGQNYSKKGDITILR